MSGSASEIAQLEYSMSLGTDDTPFEIFYGVVGIAMCDTWIWHSHPFRLNRFHQPHNS